MIRPVKRRRPNSSAACPFEAIEPRLMMAGHVEDVGTLNGRFFHHQTGGGNGTPDIAETMNFFTVTRA
jgi:hypothetical protein